MQSAIRLMVVDDHPLARQGVVSMLQALDDRFEVVAQASGIDEAVQLGQTMRPAIVLTDLHFGPGEQRNGLDLIALLQAQCPDLQCIMITSEVHDVFMLKAHDAGARAFLHKHAAAAEIARAIEAVASGFTHFPAQLKIAMDQRAQAPALTAREVELIPYIAKGLTAKEIARAITQQSPDSSLTDRTVEVHKGNIKRKFDLSSANALITFSIEYCQDHRINYRTVPVRGKG